MCSISCPPKLGGRPSAKREAGGSHENHPVCAFGEPPLLTEEGILFPSGKDPAFIEGAVRSCRCGQKKRISFAQDPLDVIGIHVGMADRNFVLLARHNDSL